jgi:hypothetical protein
MTDPEVPPKRARAPKEARMQPPGPLMPFGLEAIAHRVDRVARGHEGLARRLAQTKEKLAEAQAHLEAAGTGPLAPVPPQHDGESQGPEAGGLGP